MSRRFPNIAVNRYPGMVLRVLLFLLALLMCGSALAQGMMSEQTYNRLERIYDMMDEENYEDALESTESARERARNDHERAIIAQVLGFIYLNMDDYNRGLDAFLTALSYGDQLPVNPRLNIMGNVAQIYAQRENWETTVEYVDKYIDLVDESEDKDDAPSRIYLLGAQANMQLDRYRAALPYIRKAIELEEEPKESYYRALLGIYFELEEFRNALATLEEMVKYWPDKMAYWFQMFSINVELGQDERALSVLRLAHRKDLFEEETHYVNLYRLYMLEGAPFDAANVLEEGMNEGVVPRNERRLQMLSRALIRAQEFDRAISVLGDISELTDDGEADMRIAQLEQEQADWDSTYQAAMRAYEKGGLDDPGRALLLAGRAAAENKDFDEALAVFERAMQYEDVRNQANQWVNYIEEERMILEGR